MLLSPVRSIEASVCLRQGDLGGEEQTRDESCTDGKNMTQRMGWKSIKFQSKVQQVK
jgi:hypothetical protein